MGGVTKNAELLFARVGSVPRVILGQSCVWLSDAALDDSFNCFMKSSANML